MIENKMIIGPILSSMERKSMAGTYGKQREIN